MAKTTSTERITTPRTSTASTLLYTFEREAIRPTRRLRRPPRCTPRFIPRSPRSRRHPHRALSLSARSLPLRLWLPFPLERVVHRLGARRVPQGPGRRDAVRERRLRRLRRSSRFHDGDDGAGVVHDDGDGRLHQRRLLRGRVDDALPFVQSHGERDGNARDRHLALFVFVGSSGSSGPSRLCRFRFPSPPVWTASRGRPRTRRARRSLGVRRWRRGVRRR